jgi:CheY-like chemotaxis protein
VRLEQVFSNLIANASKYSPSGAPITIQLRSTPKEVEISVSDKGMGIEESALEKIFTPFHQGESVQQNKKGLGIGLALVRGFVDMHDGTVIAESAGLGKGSTFTVTLPSVPTKKDEPSPKQTIHKKQTFMPSEPTKSGPRVLVVDDNEAAASGMGRLLDLKGCTVFYAYDGEHAIKEAEEAEPDVILLDIGLPDMDGYTVARTIRTQGYQGRLIALTGFSTDDARAKGASAGFDHYLIKPIGFEEIKQVIPEIA